jgi:hypothetical protein
VLEHESLDALIAQLEQKIAYVSHSAGQSVENRSLTHMDKKSHKGLVMCPCHGDEMRREVGISLQLLLETGKH